MFYVAYRQKGSHKQAATVNGSYSTEAAALAAANAFCAQPANYNAYDVYIAKVYQQVKLKEVPMYTEPVEL